MEKYSKRLANWMGKYKLLVDYYKEHGNIDVPQSYVVDDIKLGYWVYTQRRVYNSDKNYRLNDEQIRLLNNLGIKWDIREEKWDEYYYLLEEYYKEHGNIDVPTIYEVGSIKLGIWLSSQRSAYHGKTTGVITENQIELLNDLGMKWSIREEKWDKHYSLLVEYYKEHGNIDVPRYYTVNNINLGKWLTCQRYAISDKSRSAITEEQIELLNRLGMKWGIRDEKWDKHYSLLEEYYKEHGNIDISRSYVVNDVSLGAWLCYQRSAYKGKGLGVITNEQIKKLNDLNIDWSVNDTRLLNRCITSENVKDYNRVLLERLNHVLEDLSNEGFNQINSSLEQEELEKVIVKRLFR